MLTKMTKEELIKEVEKLQNDIESLHAELRMVYEEKRELQRNIDDFKRDMVC